MGLPLAHTPVFHAYVDFADSTQEATDTTTFDFLNATEISEDVELLDISGRGKNLLKQEAEAVVWTAVLKNTTNKYTPSYINSPIWPNQLPGKQVWALMGYPADTWQRLNNDDTLNGKAPDHDATFGVWETHNGNQFSYIASEDAIAVSYPGKDYATLDFLESDCHVGALIRSPNEGEGVGNWIGVVFRYTDTQNYWYAIVDFNEVIVLQMLDGAPSVMGTSTVSWGYGETHWLIVEMTGDTIRVFIDSQNVITTITNSFNSTATKHGIIQSSISSSAYGRFYEFGGYCPVFRGRTDTWVPNFDPTIQQCTMNAYDDLERQYLFPVMRTAPAAPTYAGDIVNEILDAVGFPTYHRAVDQGAILLSAAFTGLNQERLLTRDALTEIQQVEGDDAGFYWMDGTGLAHYESYAFRLEQSSVRTWYGNRQNNNETDICFHYQGAAWDDGKDRVLNDLIYNYYFMSVAAVAPVWTLNNALDIPFIAHGTIMTVVAVGGSAATGNTIDQIANPILPLKYTDYTVNTAADGSGTDITPQCQASLDTQYGGNVAVVTLANEHPSLDGYVTFFQLRASGQTNSYVTGCRGLDNYSLGSYGDRRLNWDTLHIADFTTCQAQVNKMLALRKDRKAHFTFVMTNATRANIMQILHRTISERVTLVYDPITLDFDFNIERWSLHIPQEGLNYFECTWELQAVPPWLSAVISVSPSSKDFGGVAVGSTSAAATFTVTNTASAGNLLVNKITISGISAVDFSIENDNVTQQAIAPGDSATFQVVFHPITPGSLSATLNIYSNGLDNPWITEALTGVGIPIMNFGYNSFAYNAACYNYLAKSTQPVVPVAAGHVYNAFDYNAGIYN